MLGYLTNKKIREEFHFNNEGEILFLQKIKELVHNNSGVSYSYKIHNAYSILSELKSVIEDFYYGRTNGFVLEDVRKEAYEILEKDLIFPINQPALYAAISEEIKKGFSIDKSSKSINESDMPRVYALQNTISTLERTYKIMSYLRDNLDMLKQAIDKNDCEKIIALTECLISSVIITKRSISHTFYMIGQFFEKSEKEFNDCWKLWVSYLLRINERNVCFFEVNDEYENKILNTKTGSQIKTQYPDAIKLEIINEESTYFCVEIDVPAGDRWTIAEKAFQVYKKEMGIVEFTTAKVESLVDNIIVYNVHFNSFSEWNLKNKTKGSEYKPYKQYHKNIDKAVREFIDSIKNEVDKNKVETAIINSCNFEGEGKTYNFLLLWSSLEALFRSNQYPTAISAIKDIVPNILTQRYIYYRLYDFLTDCKNIEITYQYQGQEVITDFPKDENIELLFHLLRDDSEKEAFLLKCKNEYELLYHKGKELEIILMNAQTVKQKIERHKQVLAYQLQRMYRIRNKFVHHSIVDEHIDVLYKHIRVYMWEAIREMSYVATVRKINTLEELYSYFRMNNTMMKKTLMSANSPLEFKNFTKGYLL